MPLRYLCAGFAGLLLAQAAGAAEPAPARALTTAYNASGHDLFTEFIATPGNIVFSPYSIGTAMAMVLAGARGDTEREMATVLRHNLSPAAIDAANARVLAVLNGYDKSDVPVACPSPAMHFNGSECEASVPANGMCPAGYLRDERCIAPGRQPSSATLKAANALMLLKPNGNLISAAYAARLADKYGAQVFRDADLGTINGWVDRQTAGKIDRILDQIDPDTPTVVLNAVYFKAAWAAPFMARATRDDDFKLTPTSTVKVPPCTGSATSRRSSGRASMRSACRTACPRSRWWWCCRTRSMAPTSSPASSTRRRWRRCSPT
jgi:serpin B